MRPEPVTIMSGGRRLYGLLELPDGTARGGVVLVHGWDGCRIGPHRILVNAARHLQALGFVTLRFDLSGRGDSEGEPLKTDLDMMISDASVAVGSLRERLSRPSPVAMLGMCSGGNVALAASPLRDDVRAVVAWSTYPFQEQRTAAQDVKRTRHFAGVYLSKALRPETWKKLLTGRVNLRAIRRVLLGHHMAEEGSQRDQQRSRRDVLGALGAYKGRMLFVFGAKDPEAVDAERMFRAFCSQHGLSAAFASIQGANHNFQSLPWKNQAIELTGRWLSEALAG
jgi:dienelactone hydrolase